MSVLFSKLFLFKCNLSVLRLTPLLCLLSLPLVLTRLLSLIRRVRPPNELLSPTIDSIALSLFPIGWFYGFLYYTDVPSLVFVLLTVIMALENRHGMASLVRLNFFFSESYLIVQLCTVWITQLYIQTNEYNLGSLCICI